MGLSFHYRGSINKYSDIDPLVEEVEDICKSLRWDYHILNNHEPFNDANINNTKFINYSIEDLRGIIVCPENSESLSLTFLPNKNLCCPAKLVSNDPVKNDLMIEVIHTKTQFAGPDTHIALMKLLKYLKEKYIHDLDVNDEGLYSGEWNKEALLDQFAKYDGVLDMVTKALSGFKSKPGEDIHSLTARLEEILLKKFNGNKS
jgi:hypothetical protein